MSEKYCCVCSNQHIEEKCDVCRAHSWHLPDKVFEPSEEEKSLAQIAESLKSVGEFFEHLNKGEVYLIQDGGGDMHFEVSPKAGEGE